jgi:hypothetical protein
MPKISSYKTRPIDSQTLFLGTNVSDSSKTENYRATDVAAYAKKRSHIEVITTSYAVQDLDDVIYVDDDIALGAVTIVLPLAASSNERVLTVMKKGTTANVIVAGSGLDLINGFATSVLASQYATLTVHCDGLGWYIIVS